MDHRRELPVAYRAPRLPGDDAIRRAIEPVVISGNWNRGPLAARFERAFAARAGTREAVLFSSATSALTLLLRADAAGSRVNLPALQFPPVLAALRGAGLTPRFLDVDSDCWTVRASQLETDAAIPGAEARDTAGFVGAPSFGELGSSADAESWSGEHGRPVWFDSCHAFGASLEGRPAGSFGRAEVFSLTPSKLVVAGEGGVVTTNDESLAAELRVLRDYGKRPDGTFDARGESARPSEWTAAIGLASLELVDSEIARRRSVFAVYRDELDRVEGIAFPAAQDGLETNAQECVIRVERDRCGAGRDDLVAALQEHGIEAIPSYLKCLPGDAGGFPVARSLASELLHLPMGINVDESVAAGIARRIAFACRGRAS